MKKAIRKNEKIIENNLQKYRKKFGNCWKTVERVGKSSENQSWKIIVESCKIAQKIAKNFHKS